ncbi:MAG: hypothetical protein JW838_02195 [Spirochaetes bacterium]|nr:hypothetical protein [Spirochaetota bacterium]
MTTEEAEKIITIIERKGPIGIGHYIAGYESLAKTGPGRYQYTKTDTTMDYMAPTEEVRHLTRDELKALLRESFNYGDLAP